MFLPSVAIHNNMIHITMLYNSPSQSALGSLDAERVAAEFSNSQPNNITLHGKKSIMNNKYRGFLSPVSQRYLLLTLNLEFLSFPLFLLSFVL